jgi:dehydrogenase/reductase SDR family protein 12
LDLLLFFSTFSLALALPITKRLNSIMGAGLSTTQWYVYGKLHFTQNGYIRHMGKYTTPVQSSPSIGRGVTGADGVDLNGKVVVITGANSGIGKSLSTYAAAKGANVYMICRSYDRAKMARDEIVQTTSNSSVNIVLADVSELDQVKSAVKEVQSKETCVDVLYCNAGKLLNDRQTTSDGTETTVAAHLIGGSYLLSKLCMPLLKASAAKGNDPKVIFVTSGGMLLNKLPDWDILTNKNPESYDGVKAYSYAKRGQVILAEEFAEENTGITFLSAHPGWTATDALDEAFGSNKSLFEPLRNLWSGSEGLAWFMGARKNELINGGFYLDRKPQSKHVAGLFMTEGSFTKNSKDEVNDFFSNLKKMCGI